MSKYQINWGKLTKYIEDDDVTDIMYSDQEVWVSRISTGLSRLNLEINDSFFEVICTKLASNMNAYFNESKPELDAEFNGLRVNAIHKGSAPSGIVVAIRKTPKVCRINTDNAISTGYATQEVLNFLSLLIKSRCNILISGETGTGKTELIKFLFNYTSDYERAITIEDTLELHLKTLYPSKNIISLKETKNVSTKQLVKSCLRQNPDWILVSESRGEEVKEMLSTIATGHSIITTLHSEDAMLIPTRIQFMTRETISLNAIHQLIDIGIHLEIEKDELGHQTRYIAEIVEFGVNDNNQPIVNLLYQRNKPLNDIVSNKLKLKLEKVNA